MIVLHAQWIPPQRPEEPGGVLFWAEDSNARPGFHRLAAGQRKQVQPHPFVAQVTLVSDALRRPPAIDMVTLRLPSTDAGPLPSPKLAHSWERSEDGEVFLAPWTVSGLYLLPQEALPVLLDLPRIERAGGLGRTGMHIVVGDDAHYWRIAASLAIEGLVAQKLVPVLERHHLGRPRWNRNRTSRDQRGNGSANQEVIVSVARWQMVLDSPRDAQRLNTLVAAMPPACRAAIPTARSIDGADPDAPRALLTGFLNSLGDALARQWGYSAIDGTYLREGSTATEPAERWLAALFQADPRVKGTPAQLQALEVAFGAWIRNLHLAGDNQFRVALQLEPPALDENAPINTEQEWQLRFALQARDDPSLMLPAETIWKSTNGALAALGRRIENPQERLLAGLGYAGRLFRPIAEGLTDRTPTAVTLTTNQAYRFLREAAPLLEEAGFGVLVPPWWNQRGARLGMRLHLAPARGATPEAVARGKLSMEKLINYRWELSIGDTALSEEEFRALAALKAPLLQIRGQWVQLDPEQIEAAIRFWEGEKLKGKISLLEALQMQMSAAEAASRPDGLPIDDVITEGWLDEWMDRFQQPGRLTELPQPEALHGELRPYQRYGYSWLSFFRRWGLGAILADDMGLGKTVQTLALLVQEKQTLGAFPSPVLLVCPTSVVTNWERETARFTPSLKTCVHQGPNRKRGADFLEAVKDCDLVLTSYALVRLDAATLQKMNWHAVILDEAQNIKNHTARQTQAARSLPAGWRLALTGTPVENRLSELWSIMHFLNPGYLGSHENFRQNFALPIERYNDAGAAAQLRRVVAPFILRRVKSDPNVIQDLPEKLETKVYCNLTEEQATLYQAIVEEAMQKVESSGGIERRGNVLAMLMRLKQVCNHPVQFLHQVRAPRVLETVYESPADMPGLDPQREAMPALDTRDLVDRSGKLERLVELLEEMIAEGGRALIFSQFAEMGELLAETLPGALGVQTLFLHGGVPQKSRETLIRRFQDEQNGPPIFLLTLKAGGTGLNLTRANHVFHFDRWWNPAVEDQATDRAFRIGQKRNVQVHKFVTIGTLEESIDEMIESKKGLAQNILGSGESWLTDLSTDDLRELVSLRR